MKPDAESYLTVMATHRGWLTFLLLPALLLHRLLDGSSALIIFGSSCSNAFVEEPHAFCVFPSKGKDGDINQCQSTGQGTDAWWCPTTRKYCTDAAYKWCPDTSTTYAGSDPGRECHFPFWYRGVEYRHCLRLDTRDNYLWCSTTPGNYSGRWTRCRELPDLMPCQFKIAASSVHFDSELRNSSWSDDIERQCVRRDGLWTCRTGLGQERRCPDTATTEAGNDPGRSCRFPFKLDGAWHNRCIAHRPNSSRKVGHEAQATDEAFEWCATTDSFDRDRLWTRCRQAEPPGLSGLQLLLAVAGGVLTVAFAASCILYSCCEPSAPCQRGWRQRQSRRRHQSETTRQLRSNKTDLRLRRSQQRQQQQHQQRPLPTAPSIDEVDAAADFRLPTYEEVLAQSAAEQVQRLQASPPLPPPASLCLNYAAKCVISFDESDRGVPL